jgi:hypothetical protein
MLAGNEFPLQPKDLTEHPVDVGERTEAIILGELVRRGYKVLLPFGHNQRYDLVIDNGSSFIRVQCKTGRLTNGAVRFRSQSVITNTKGSQFRSYGGEADLFVVFCPQNGKTYAVPVDSVPESEVALRIAPAGNNQRLGIRWATEYELPA